MKLSRTGGNKRHQLFVPGRRPPWTLTVDGIARSIGLNHDGRLTSTAWAGSNTITIMGAGKETEQEICPDHLVFRSGSLYT